MYEGKCDLRHNKSPQFETKDGLICFDCYSSLPTCVRDYLKEYKNSQLKKIARKFEKPAYLGSPIFSTDALTLHDTGLVFSGVFLTWSNILRVKINCHPLKSIGLSSIQGIVTFEIETKKPHMVLEDHYEHKERFINYTQKNGKFMYDFPYCAMQLKELIEYMIEHPEKKASETQYAKRIISRAKKNSYDFKKNQSYTRSNTNQRTNYSSGSKSSGHQKEYVKKTEPDYKRAINVFGMAPPFTLAQLKARRNQLLRKYHPDQGVKNDEMAKEINTGFTVLAKLADR